MLHKIISNHRYLDVRSLQILIATVLGKILLLDPDWPFRIRHRYLLIGASPKAFSSSGLATNDAFGSRIVIWY